MRCKYLLLVPLEDGPRLDGLDREDTVEDHVRSFESRKSSRPQVLEQEWFPLETHLDLTGVSTREESVVARAAVAAIQGRYVAALELTSPQSGSGKADDTQPTIEDVERWLTTVAADYLSQALGVSSDSIPWVGRYLLEDRVPVNWHSPGAQSEELSSNMLSGSTANITLGWGNGSIRGWEFLSESDKKQLVRGLVDAQYIWLEVSLIADDCLFAIRELHTDLDGTSLRSQVRGRPQMVEGLRRRLVDHHLAMDDLLLNVQGLRQQTARVALSAWHYLDVSARTDRRVDEAMQLFSLYRQRREARFQSIVEWILLAMSLLGLAQFTTGLISTAYSGTVNSSPGEGSSLGLLAWVRSTDADVLILVTILLTAAIVLLLVRRRGD